MTKNEELKSDQLFENQISREWLSIGEASKLYPISINTFYKYKLNGLPVRKLGKRLIIKRSELEEWLERWAA